jgi:hypothetical protein
LAPPPAPAQSSPIIQIPTPAPNSPIPLDPNPTTPSAPDVYEYKCPVKGELQITCEKESHIALFMKIIIDKYNQDCTNPDNKPPLMAWASDQYKSILDNLSEVTIDASGKYNCKIKPSDQKLSQEQLEECYSNLIKECPDQIQKPNSVLEGNVQQEKSDDNKALIGAIAGLALTLIATCLYCNKKNNQQQHTLNQSLEARSEERLPQPVQGLPPPRASAQIVFIQSLGSEPNRPPISYV